MFIEINGLAYNLMFAQSIDKLDEDGKYKILYAISNENKLVEEFDNEADRDAKYELAQEASSTAGIKEEIEQIEQDIQHLQEIGFHPLVVEELPEDPEEFILYLVPAEDFEETNIYNEFLYVNNEWEQIGTTGVDLSGYYTKEEIDSSVIKSIIIEQSFSSNPDSIRLDENNLTKLNNFISTLPQEGAATIFNVWLVPSESVSGSPSQKNDYVTFFNIKKGNPNNNYTAELITLNLNKYDNKVASTTAFVNYRSDSSGHVGTISSYYVSVPTEDRVFTTNEKVLTKTNTTAFTPTADYHPATKKYVDDLLANIDLSKVTGFINLHNNSSNNPLVLSTLEPGMYIVSNDTWSGASFTMVARPGNRSTTIFDFDLNRFACLFIENKIPEVYDNVRRSVYLSIKDADRSGVYIILDDGYSLTQQWNLSKELLTTSTSQTITSKKTFNTLPESSVTPTTNNQLVNKKYVDDSIVANKTGVRYLELTSDLDIKDLEIGVYYIVPNNHVISYSYSSPAYTFTDIPNRGFIMHILYNESSPSNTYIAYWEDVESRDQYLLYANDFGKPTLYNSTPITTSGNQTVSGLLTFGQLPRINGSLNPTMNNQLVHKKYVDDAISSVSPIVGVTHSRLGTDSTNSWWVHSYNINTEIGNNSLGTLANVVQSVYNDCISYIKDVNLTHLIRIQALDDVLLEWKFGNSTSWSPKTYMSYVNIFYKNSGLIAKRTIYANPNLRSDGTIESWYNFSWGDTTLNALGTNNTTSYTPTADYNPATKKYVDDAIAAAITDALGGSY